MPIDETPDADIVVTIAVAPKKQTWANSIYWPGRQTIRNTGTLETGTNAHSGLAIACTQALKSISKDALKKLNVVGTPVIRLVCEDAAFVAAINQLAAKEKVIGLRSARSLFIPLAHSLKRGRVVTQVLPSTDNRIQSLKGWASNQLTPEKEGRVSLRVFTPKRVQESVSLSV